MSVKPNRPKIIDTEIEVFPINKKTGKTLIIDALLSDNYVLIEDFYSTGLKVLFELKKNIFTKTDNNDFKNERKKRSVYHLASNKILIPVETNKIALRKAPDIEWLKILYPETSNFLLPLPQIQGLNSSWQWYVKGIKYPVLNYKIFPYYGTYFPTRFEHLIIFENWLKTYNDKKTQAIDIGTGCGVLTFQLINNGFKKVYASDINENSIISVSENADKLGFNDKIILKHDDLFDNCNIKADLIVFNPPWLPANKDNTIIDKAIYYEPDFFERFFRNAVNHLNDDGKIAILFSNFAQSTGLTKNNPIEKELADNNIYKQTQLIKSKVKKSSRKTKRKDWRKNEYVELRILEKRV